MVDGSRETMRTGSRYGAVPRRSTVGPIDATIRTESLTKHLDVNRPVLVTFLPLAAVLGASLGLTAVLGWVGIKGFRRRVLA